MQTPDQYKIVRDAVAAREAAEAKLVDATTELERQRQKFRDWETHAAEAQLAHAKPTSKRRRLDQLEEAESQVRVCQEAVNIAHQREKDAKREARSRTLRALQTEYTKAIRDLDQALDHAASVNARVQRLYREGRDALGREAAIEPLFWRELALDTTDDTKIKAWRRTVNSKLRADEPDETSKVVDSDEEAYSVAV